MIAPQLANSLISQVKLIRHKSHSRQFEKESKLQFVILVFKKRIKTVQKYGQKV